MDWASLRETFPRERGMPERAFRLAAFEAVLDGTLYDGLKHPFSKEKHFTGEYIPLGERRPSVRTNLCRVVVEDSVSLLFSEGHWPAIRAKAEATTAALAQLVKDTRLNETMLEAATRGSVGSVAIRFRCLKNKPFFDVLPTACLTPEYDPEDPETLVAVTERYLTKGAELAAIGYPISSDDVGTKFWFQRQWTCDEERWFLPVPCTAEGLSAIPKRDERRSLKHNLGFVPILWIVNLPSSKRSDIDGACTFEPAIDTVIETDYLLSQGGRGLKYASDPTLVLKHGDDDADAPARQGGAASALSVPPGGDAKLLEINGSAAGAVMEHVRALRAIALEAKHGNRAHADKLSAATSGRSIELMMAGLIWLADRMRTSYGEGGLLSLMRMVCEASRVMPGGVIIGGKAMRGLDPEGLQLRWTPWMAPMPHDLLETAQGLVTAMEGRVISQETASARMGALLDVEDAAAELARIKEDMAGAANAHAVRDAANTGKTLAREVTA